MQNGKKYFVIDFDSTFTQVEALDVLAEISLEGHPEKKERIEKIKRKLGDQRVELARAIKAKHDVDEVGFVKKMKKW